MNGMEANYESGSAGTPAETFSVDELRPEASPQAVRKKSDETSQHFDVLFSNASNEGTFIPTCADSLKTSSAESFVSASKLSIPSPSKKKIIRSSIEDFHMSEAMESWQSSEKLWFEKVLPLVRVLSSGRPQRRPGEMYDSTSKHPKSKAGVTQNKRPATFPNVGRNLSLAPIPQGRLPESNMYFMRPSTAPPFFSDFFARSSGRPCSSEGYGPSRNPSREGKGRMPSCHPREASGRVHEKGAPRYASKKLTGVMRPFSAFGRLTQKRRNSKNYPSSILVVPKRRLSAVSRSYNRTSRLTSASPQQSAMLLPSLKGSRLSSTQPSILGSRPTSATRPASASLKISTLTTAVSPPERPSAYAKENVYSFKGKSSKSASSPEEPSSSTQSAYRSRSIVRSLMKSATESSKRSPSNSIRSRKSGTGSKISTVQAHVSNCDGVSAASSDARRTESNSSASREVPPSRTPGVFPPHFYPRQQSSALYGTFPGDKPPPLPYKPPHQALRPDGRISRL